MTADSRASARAALRPASRLALCGLCALAVFFAATPPTHAQLVPPADAYEWSDDTDTGDATDSANWHAPDGSDTLPPTGAHLVIGKRANENGSWGDITGLGAPGLTHFGSLWFGEGLGLDDDFRSTLSGSEITVGVGMGEIDRLIVARGLAGHTLDLDVVIHAAPGLDFRILNEISMYQWSSLEFLQSLTSTGTLRIEGYGRTEINTLLGSGDLIKTGAGALYLNASGYTGAVTIRDGLLAGELSGDSALTLAGGVYGADGSFERSLGTGAGTVHWEAGKSGGFSAYDGGTTHVTLDGGRTLTWGEAHFVGIGSELLFGSDRDGGTLYWNNALDLGGLSGTRTIRLSEYNYTWGSTPLSLYLNEELIATAGQTLRFIGTGSAIIGADNSQFYGALDLSGVKVSLRNGGRLSEVQTIAITRGGTLEVEIESGANAALLGIGANLTLDSGTLIWSDYSSESFSRELGDIVLTGGANRIENSSLYSGYGLHAQSLTRSDPRATLLVALMENYNAADSLMDFDNGDAIQASAIGGITPWLITTTGPQWDARSDWGVFDTGGGLKPLLAYYEGSEATWEAGHNVNATGSWEELTADRTINSLRVDGQGVSLNGNTLTIGSGGLLFSGNYTSLYDEGGGAVTTAGGRPLYIHVPKDEASITARLTGGMDLVKTGANNLSLYHSYNTEHTTHELGAIYIHQGTLRVMEDVGLATTGTIIIGDGGSEARLHLVATPWNKDQPILTGSRDIRLRGGHDYNGKTANLTLEGENDLHLNSLTIEGSSVLEFQFDWRGGTSKIYSEVFTLDGQASRLLVLGWLQRQGFSGSEVPVNSAYTHILVRKTSPNLDGYLPRIWFDEYGPAKKINWTEDDTYWEIVPGAFNGLDAPGPPPAPGIPEPHTTGALLATAGLALALWRRHRSRNKG